jgi:hypothetical protein
MRIHAAVGWTAVLTALALPAAGAEWQIVRRNQNAILSVDTKSVKRTGDEVAFEFLIDFREGQGDIKQGPQYRSVVTPARVRCKARTISLGASEAFITNRAQGPPTGRTDPKAAKGSFSALEKGSSDEDLWRYFCEPKAAEPKKPETKK